ncbi:MAG TPA: DNA mismatch repair protein MutL, partial [Erysipelotrichaceae bacterium]|nr:DNA mismatch repair protein MutL [Erysipelotrichaceae bacterium]
IEVGPAIVNQLDLINQQLDCIKLKFEQFSMNSIVTREVPDFFEQIDEVHFIHDLINEIVEDRQMNRIDIRKEKIASLACHSSVRFNQYLSIAESQTLLVRLSKCKQPFNCPHGRPTMIAINEKDLIKEFKRA